MRAWSRPRVACCTALQRGSLGALNLACFSLLHVLWCLTQAVEGGDGLQVAMADDSEALLVTEWKLYLVQVGGGMCRCNQLYSTAFHAHLSCARISSLMD